jgi:plastocyanin
MEDKTMGKQTFNKIKKSVTILLVIFFVATLTATSVSAKTVDVSIKNYAFNPASVGVSKGDFVMWTNYDNVDHAVLTTSGPVIISSGDIHPGKSYEVRMTTPGTYDYKCSIHPTMRGTLKVV